MKPIVGRTLRYDFVSGRFSGEFGSLLDVEFVEFLLSLNLLVKSFEELKLLDALDRDILNDVC